VIKIIKYQYDFFCFLSFVDLRTCIISQITPTSCTILFNIFIYFSSLHVSGVCVPIIRRKLLYLCDTGICHSVWMASGLLVGLQSNQQTRRHPYSDKCQCRMDTVIFSWWWAHGRPKHVEKRNKYIKQNCAPSWIYLRDYQHDYEKYQQHLQEILSSAKPWRRKQLASET
jgi:hypothetical protein